MDAVFCHQCGQKNPEGVNFCSSCGTALVTSAPDTSVSVHPFDELPEGGETAALTAIELPRGVGLLVVKRGASEGARLALEQDVVRAGRHPESELFLDDVTVSRRHAEFVTVDGVTTLRDVGSLNGTYVNRERIEEAVLASGDEVQIGKFQLVYLKAAGE